MGASQEFSDDDDVNINESEDNNKVDEEQSEATDESQEAASNADKDEAVKQLVELLADKDFRDRLNKIAKFIAKRRGVEDCDIEQEAYEAILEKIKQLKSKAAIKAWLNKILRNKMIDQYRRQQRDEKYADQERIASDRESTGNAVEKNLVDKIALKEAISKLHQEDRALVDLYRQGYTIAEIIRAQSLPESQTYKRWEKILQSLAKFMV